MSDFKDFYREYTARSTFNQSRIGVQLLLSSAAISPPAANHSARDSRLHFQVFVATPAAAHVGRLLMDLDVELRRALSFLTSESVRPEKHVRGMELVSAEREAYLKITALLSPELSVMLATRPLDFLRVLWWFWDHRLTCTKTRITQRVEDPARRWDDLERESLRQVELGEHIFASLIAASEASASFGVSSLSASPLRES